MVLFALFLLLALPGCNSGTDKNRASIENGKIELGFNKEDGSLSYFLEVEDSRYIVDTNIVQGSLWEMDVIKPSGIEKVDMSDATDFTFSKPDPGTLLLEWSNFPELENKDLKVVAKVRLEKDNAMSYWSISLEGTKGMEINQLVYPRIEGVADMGDEYLAVPTWLGYLYSNPRESLQEMVGKKLYRSLGKQASYTFSYPNLSLQLLAWYDPDTYGLYLACNDSAAYSKSFSFSMDSVNNLTYTVNHFPSVDATSDQYSTPNESIVGVFHGDWMTAAEIYREWGEKQPWCRESRLQNDLVQPWVKETAIWVWNRLTSDRVLEPALDLKERSGLPVSVFWHWWHNCSYDEGFPEYVPPREGKESFISAMKKANDNDVRAIVYMNSFQWGTETESWKDENAFDWAVKDLNGNTRSHVYNIFTGNSLTNMCMATDFWQNKYASLSDSVVNTYQTNGVYMDQACTHRLCYDKSHGHAIGGGNYWVDGYAKLVDLIREKTAATNESVLAGEGCCEAWLPMLDVFLTLSVSKERYAGVGNREPIPLYSMVYHKYGVMYGSYSSLIVPPYDELWPEEYAPKDPEALLSADFNKQYLMEQARTLVWGTTPTIANYRDFLATQRKEEIDYLINLAKVRQQGLKYLLYGTMFRSPEIDIPTEEIDISRLSIYAGKTGNTVTALKAEVPIIYTGTWKADDGYLGIAVASISDDPFELNFSFNADDYDLPSDGNIYVIDVDGRRLLTEYTNGQIKVDTSLPPKGLWIIEITPAD